MADFKTAHFWAAKFDSKQAEDNVFKEQYEDDEEAISIFGKAQDEWYYNRDTFYVERIENRGLENVLLKTSFSKEAIAEIIKEWNEKIPNSFNAIVAGDEDEFSKPRDSKLDGAEFIYFGCYKHNRWV